MSREYPDWVNPWKAAEGGRIFSGTIPLHRMSRLKPLLAEAGDDAGFTASFALDGEKRAVITLEVTAELPLICQATLEIYRQPVTRQSLLAVIEDQSDQESLPEHYEPTCTYAGRLGFTELVEDELLLAIPQVPRKPGLEEFAYSTDPGASEDSRTVGEGLNKPFATLKKMLHSSGEEQDTE
jgi:uncharacterized protein